MIGVGITVGALLWLSGNELALGQQLQPTSFPAYRAPRLTDGHPDLNGIWQAFVTANIDLQDHEAQAGPRPEIIAARPGDRGGRSDPVSAVGARQEKGELREADGGRRDK
jgi:hypothetical protein